MSKKKSTFLWKVVIKKHKAIQAKINKYGIIPEKKNSQVRWSWKISFLVVIYFSITDLNAVRWENTSEPFWHNSLMETM